MNRPIESRIAIHAACVAGNVKMHPTVSPKARRHWLTQRRLETLWAWGSLLTLILCWDAALRLDQHVSPPRVRIAHAVELERPEPAMESSPVR